MEAGGAFPFEKSSSEDWLPPSLDGGSCCIIGTASALDGSESILKSIKLSMPPDDATSAKSQNNRISNVLKGYIKIDYNKLPN